jgi:hypothetical protein
MAPTWVSRFRRKISSGFKVDDEPSVHVVLFSWVRCSIRVVQYSIKFFWVRVVVYVRVVNVQSYVVHIQFVF